MFFVIANGWVDGGRKEKWDRGREYFIASSLLDHFTLLECECKRQVQEDSSSAWLCSDLMSLLEVETHLLNIWNAGASLRLLCPLEGHRMESDQLTMIPRDLSFSSQDLKDSDERHVFSYEEQNASHPWRVLKARKVHGPKLSGLPLSKDVQDINSA